MATVVIEEGARLAQADMTAISVAVCHLLQQNDHQLAAKLAAQVGMRPSPGACMQGQNHLKNGMLQGL